MIQAVAETIFDVAYLSFAIILGFCLLIGGGSSLIKKFGVMSLVLGVGDAFHLVPRVYALWTTGLEANATALGIGKLITSITMTIFYVLLYYVWRERYDIKGEKNITVWIWILAIVRVGLCLLPQNQWLIYNPPLLFGILRNIPFLVMGIIIIVLFSYEIRKNNDRIFRFMPIAIALSFLFYIVVVVFSSIQPMIGMLMIPKTLAYVWILLMGWTLYKEEKL